MRSLQLPAVGAFPMLVPRQVMLTESPACADDGAAMTAATRSGRDGAATVKVALATVFAAASAPSSTWSSASVRTTRCAGPE